MKRLNYLLVDPRGVIHGRFSLPEEEPVSLEPWMLHKINQEGWRLKVGNDGQPEDSGVALHGWADWRSVADNLATVLRVMLDDEKDLSEDDAEQVLEQAAAALEDYQVAQMEASMAEADQPLGDDSDDSDDGETDDPPDEEPEGAST